MIYRKLKTIEEVENYLINRDSSQFVHELEWDMLRMLPHERYTVTIRYGIEVHKGGTFTGTEMIQMLSDAIRLRGL